MVTFNKNTNCSNCNTTSDCTRCIKRPIEINVSCGDNEPNGICPITEEIQPKFKVGDTVKINSEFHERIYRTIYNEEMYIEAEPKLIKFSNKMKFIKEKVVAIAPSKEFGVFYLLSNGLTYPEHMLELLVYKEYSAETLTFIDFYKMYRELVDCYDMCSNTKCVDCIMNIRGSKSLGGISCYFSFPAHSKQSAELLIKWYNKVYFDKEY